MGRQNVCTGKTKKRLMNNYMSLGDAISRFLAKYELEDKVLIQSVLTEWEKLCREKRSLLIPIRFWFEKGTLFIKVSSPTWRNELNMSRLRLKQMINNEVKKRTGTRCEDCEVELIST